MMCRNCRWSHSSLNLHFPFGTLTLPMRPCFFPIVLFLTLFYVFLYNLPLFLYLPVLYTLNLQIDLLNFHILKNQNNKSWFHRAQFGLHNINLPIGFQHFRANILCKALFPRFYPFLYKDQQMCIIIFHLLGFKQKSSSN